MIWPVLHGSFCCVRIETGFIEDTRIILEAVIASEITKKILNGDIANSIDESRLRWLFS